MINSLNLRCISGKICSSYTTQCLQFTKTIPDSDKERVRVRRGKQRRGDTINKINKINTRLSCSARSVKINYSSINIKREKKLQ